MENCVFCKIISGNSPETKIEYENEDLVVFKDIRPAAEHHYLAVPKIHIVSAKCLKSEDEELLNNMENSLKIVFQQKNVDINDALYGFHWPPFISVHHLHMHGIAPASSMKLISRGIFRPNSLWFCTSQYVRNRIKTSNSST